jgi:peptidyl-prolyl cis-trans isomerase-like protein 2
VSACIIFITFNISLKFVFLYQAHYSTGAVAAGFTSTVLAPQTKHEAAIIEEDLVRYERVKKKGSRKEVLYCNCV